MFLYFGWKYTNSVEKKIMAKLSVWYIEPITLVIITWSVKKQWKTPHMDSMTEN